MAGAPADFAGQVIQLPPGADPNYYKPRADTDAPYAPPMSGGATMQVPVYRGGVKMDASSPAMNQMTPSALRTVQSKSDPYAEFGGNARTQSPPTAQDPYSEFGGQAHQQPSPQSASSRFWSGVKAGMGGENALNTKVDPAHPISTNPMIPGAGVYRDIKSRNYASAAGRVLGPAAALGAALLGSRGGESAARFPEPMYPGAHLPATPPPEVLNPTLISEARTLPGQVGAERIYGPRPTPAQPIPPRQGLMLQGEVQPSTPNYAYRVRDVGETGVPSQSHSQATMSEGEARSYIDSRGTLTGKPQELVKIDLNKIPPDQYSKMSGPNGHDWIKFNSDVPESFVENAGQKVPIGKLTKEVPNPDPYKFPSAPQSMDIVQSTNVGKIGYNPDKKVMTVEYKNGFVYSYDGVPQEIYNAAKASESTGSYISRNVKGRYDTVRRGSVLVKKR